MASDDPLMGGKWVNGLIKEVVEVLDNISKDLLDILLADKYPGGTEPVTLKQLKAMGIVAAISLVEQMENDPYTQADAAKLAADYSEYLRGLGTAAVQERVQAELQQMFAQSQQLQPAV